MLDRRQSLAVLSAAVLCPHDAVARTAPPHIDVRSGLAKHFDDEGTAGVFVAYDTATKTCLASEAARASRALLPASTYKIPNSVIALDTGVVDDPDKDVFKWDGKTYAIAEWNRDHTLRTALAASAVPVYQAIARRIGVRCMQKYVDLFDYGNRNIGGGIDKFWLSGALRISPLEEITFVDKLRRGALPVSRRAQDMVRDILPVFKTGDSIIRAKTGVVAARRGQPSIGWLVGWAEKGGTQTVFALNLDIRDPKHVAARLPLAQKMLANVGAI